MEKQEILERMKHLQEEMKTYKHYLSEEDD